MVDWPLILTTKECIFCWCQDSSHHHHPVGFKHSSCYAIEAGANTDHVKVEHKFSSTAEQPQNAEQQLQRVLYKSVLMEIKISPTDSIYTFFWLHVIKMSLRLLRKLSRILRVILFECLSNIQCKSCGGNDKRKTINFSSG